MDLYLEPFGGLAGDMLLAALVHLGDERFQVSDLSTLAEALVPGEATITSDVAWRGSLSGLHLDVRTPETHNPPHRHLADLAEIVAGSPLSAAAQAFTMRVLRRIAVAEGHVHGCSPDEIHFHEVGAVDTLIDVGGCALALERLGIERAYASAPQVGSGTVRCAHGEMPVPAPATAEILRGIPTKMGGGGERCTPTGAALLVELLALGGREPAVGEPAGWHADAIGYGAGTRDPKEGPPNVVRVQVGRSASGVGAALAPNGEVCEVRANLDDMDGEAVGDLVVRLRDAGALEVWTSAVQMKKDRPGVLVSALCRPGERASIAAALFEHSSTFGVRWATLDRVEAGRDVRTVEVDGHSVRLKQRERPAYDGRSDLSPYDLAVEHDDAAALARALGISLAEARRRALDAAGS